MDMKPLIFVGSSQEGLDVARAVESQLERDARVNLWTSDIFSPGGTTIEALFEQLDAAAFAVMVLTADDLITTRGREWAGPRDNMIFELGLFLGRLGRDRTFLMFDREADLKLPSDLAGVTPITYSGSRLRESPAAALSPAANVIRARLAKKPGREIDFVKAYIAFIQPDVKLTDTYSTILVRHYNTICAEVERLESREDWSALLEVKRRLREYFEYSGRYADGVQFGRRYVRALEALGETAEALWTKAKHVGYLLILDGDHEAGRREIAEVLAAVQNSPSLLDDLKFYALRYMSISYLRDPMGADTLKSERYLAAAAEVVGQFPTGSQRRRELEARLQSNQGNLALERGDHRTAMSCYQASLEGFKQLDDQEHIGIAHLKLAQAMIRGHASARDEAARHLKTAESIFIGLGWIEGHARVLEQRTRLSLLGANSNKRQRGRYRLEAIAAANTARALYLRIRHQEGIGRMDALLSELDVST